MGYLILKDAVVRLGESSVTMNTAPTRPVDFKLEPEALPPELVNSLGAILSGPGRFQSRG